MRSWIRVIMVVAMVLMVISIVKIDKAQAEGETAEENVAERITQIRNILSSNGYKYFTSDGAAKCSHKDTDTCAECYLPNLMTNPPEGSGLSTGQEAFEVMGGSWTCASFARWVYYNLYGTNYKTDSTISYGIENAQIGDYVFGPTNAARTSGHHAIFAGWNADKTKFYLYDANWQSDGSRNKIHYATRDKNSAMYKNATIYHSNQYERLYSPCSYLTNTGQHNFVDSICSECKAWDEDSVTIYNFSETRYFAVKNANASTLKAPVRSGPYKQCRETSSLRNGTIIQVDCYLTNSYGNKWYILPGNTYIYEDNVISVKNESYGSVYFAPATDPAFTSKASISETNAVLVLEGSKTSGVHVEKTGMILYDANGNGIASCSFDSSITDSKTLFHVWFDINKELGVTLKSGTTYKYRFTAEVKVNGLGKSVCSDLYTFSTVGICHKPDPSKAVRFSDALDSFYESIINIGRNTATVAKKIFKDTTTKISTVTLRLFSSTGQFLAEKITNINVNSSYDYFHVATEIHTELGMPLAPNTTYQYEYVVTTDDNNSYSSGKSSFTTQSAPEPQISFSEPTDKYAKKAWVSFANAVVVKKINKECGTKVERSGMVLMDTNGNVIKDHSAPSMSSEDSNYFHIWFDINNELGVTLSPNTRYQYKFYVTVGGKNYYSQTYDFFTTSQYNIDIRFSVPTEHTYVMKQMLNHDNACVVSKITKPVGTLISRVGIILYDANGNTIKDFSHESISTPESSYFHLWFNIVDELGIRLSPGTTYQYRFTAYSNGQWYYSDLHSLTTPELGSAGIIFSEATDENYTQHAFVSQTNAHVVKQVSKPVGVKPDTTGMELYTTDGRLVSQHWHTSNISPEATVRHIWFNITEELGVTLQPGTTYVYHFFQTVGGQYYYSPAYTFTTLLPDVLSIGFGDPVDWHYTSRQSIADDNAVISRCVYKTFGMDVDRVGVRLYDANGNFIKNADVAVEVAGQSDNFHICLDFKNDLDFILEPSTTYKYQFYAYAHNNTYNSDMYSFTTSGCTVYLNANGGETDRECVYAALGAPIGALPTPIRPGYIFEGWYTGMNSGDQVLAETTCTGNSTLFAKWKEAVHIHSYDILLSTESVHPHRNTYACACGDQKRDEQIRYRVDCGFCGYDMMPEINVTSRDADSCTVEIITTAGEDFIFADNSSVYVTSTTDGSEPEQDGTSVETITVTGSELIQAKAWTNSMITSRAIDGQPDAAAVAESSTASLQIYRIGFDDGEGAAEYDAAFFVEGELISELPHVTAPEGYYFMGWYTEDGELVEKNSISALHEQTLYARYEAYEASDGLEYLILADGCIITGYSGNESVVNIPGTIGEVDVTEIGDAAFFQNTSITKVVLPDTIQKIGRQAFMHCENLTDINLPDGLGYIANNAFGGCYNLTDVVLPDTLTALETYAFQNCKSLTSIVIPGEIETLGESVFSGCTSIESVVLPDKITRIPNRMFANCDALTSINWPSALAEIGNSAFSRCTGFAVALPEGITRIGNYAFEYCDYENIVIPDSVAEIGAYVFWNNRKLAELSLPNSRIQLGDYCFSSCTQLTNVVIPSNWTTTGKYTFAECSALTDVSLPDGLLIVDDGAFHNCDALVSLEIPDSVEHIGVMALRHCEALESVSLPANLRSIGDNAFYRCSALKSLQIPGGVTKLGYSFNFCSALTEITIPASVTAIEKDVFSGSPNLIIYTSAGSYAETYAIEMGIPYQLVDYVFVDNSVISEDKVLLNLCYAETAELDVALTPKNASRKDVSWTSDDDTIAVVNSRGIVYPVSEGSSTIVCSANDGSNVTSSCEVLVRAYSSKLCLPSMLQALEEEAFADNKSIEYVELPSSLASIATNAFRNCTNLSCVVFSDNNTSIEQGAFSGCSKVVFLCESGSTAEAYARNNNIEYVLTD